MEVLTQKLRDNNFSAVSEEILSLYDKGAYLDVINAFKIIQKSDDIEYFSCQYFNAFVGIYLLVSISYSILGHYEKALGTMIELNNKYHRVKNIYYVFMQILRHKDFETISKEDAQEIVNHFNITLREFNKNARIRFYNNFAFCYYKNELYSSAIEFYEKALLYNRKDMQLIIGKNQALYEHYNHSLSKEVIATLKVDIKKLSTLQTNFDVYLSICKLYYFIGDFEKALKYVNLALNIIGEENKEREIYAYDWISRIAYKSKKYATAAIFYEKIIEKLIVCNKNYIINEEIHPIPELNKMFEFLTQCKEKITKHDIHYINKSIWAGIIVATLLEFFEIYSGTKSFAIPTIMVIIITLFGVIYVNVYK